MTTPTRPNIILIMADQMAAHALSFYGNTVCKTPNLDRLAAPRHRFRVRLFQQSALRAQPCLNAEWDAVARRQCL